ncbi:hypothetical protein Tco_0920713, partial [Tanacetum coccineum]
ECDEICTLEKTANSSYPEKEDEVSTNRVKQKEDSDTDNFDDDASDEELFMDKCEKEYLNEGDWIRSNSQEVQVILFDLCTGKRGGSLERNLNSPTTSESNSAPMISHNQNSVPESNFSAFVSNCQIEVRSQDTQDALGENNSRVATFGLPTRDTSFVSNSFIEHTSDVPNKSPLIRLQNNISVATQSTPLSDNEVLKTIEVGTVIGYNLDRRTEDMRAILGSSGGIIAIWDDSLFKKDRIISEEDGFLAIYGEWDKVGLECLMIVVYAPQDIKKSVHYGTGFLKSSLIFMLWSWFLVILMKSTVKAKEWDHPSVKQVLCSLMTLS